MDWNQILLEGSISPPDPSVYKYQGLVDIVIPVYNDRQGLQETLFSLNIRHKYNVVVVDDCSTDATYDDIVEFFSQFHSIELVKTSANGGPAVAKNTGAKYCNNKYITFIDAGDTFTNSEIIPQIEKILEEREEGAFLSCGHYEEGSDTTLKYIPPEHNRWMGKVYRKDFYDKNNLRFNEEMSFCNDDIGMNMLARLLATDDGVLHYDEPVIIWHINESSITRKDGHDYYYRENNMGTAKSAIYAIQEAKKRFIHPHKIKELAYSVLANMYYNCLATVNYKPEFLEEALKGAKHFYDNGFLTFNLDMTMLTDIYNITTSARLKDEDWQACMLKLPYMSFIEFLTLLEGME